MTVRQVKFAAFVGMALETGVGGTLRINNRARLATAFHVRAGRAMTRFTTNVFSTGGRINQPNMRSVVEIARDVGVALHALAAPHKI